VLLAAASAEARAELDWSADEVNAVARHGPWPPPPARDASNRVSGQATAILLGEHLFQEVRVSVDGSLSCATCHRPDRDFSDGRAKAMGRVPLDRRTPSLWNLGYAHWFGWDGAGDSLWAQSIRPILDKREMAGDAARVAGLLREDKALACGYERAFGHKPGGDDEKLLVDGAKALAAFQATLVSPRTPFDTFRDALVAGDREAMARYPAASQRGLKLFIGAGKCSTCHFGPRFTNGEFADVGIPFFVGPAAVDSGRLAGLATLAKNPFNLAGRHNDDASPASGVRTRHVQRLHANFGEFRVPGLRQAARAAAFMHNGHYATLEEVVRHYSEVSPDRLHSDGTPLVRALGLSAEQRADLVSFLRSLSVEPPARPPMAALCP
jgi:cytochrome c peroxidase